MKIILTPKCCIMSQAFILLIHVYPPNGNLNPRWVNKISDCYQGFPFSTLCPGLLSLRAKAHSFLCLMDRHSWTMLCHYLIHWQRVIGTALVLGFCLGRQMAPSGMVNYWIRLLNACLLFSPHVPSQALVCRNKQAFPLTHPNPLLQWELFLVNF